MQLKKGCLRGTCAPPQFLLSAEHALPPVTAKTTPVAHLCRFTAGRSCSESACGHCLALSESSHMLTRALRKTKGTESACLWRLWEAGAAGCLSLSQRIFLNVGTFFPSSVEHDKTFVGIGVGFGSPHLQDC